MSNKGKGLRLKMQEIFLPWGTVSLVALSANWAADAFRDSVKFFFEFWPNASFSLPRFIAIILFVGSVISLYFQRKAFFKPRTRHLKDVEEPEKRKHLIAFLSHLNPKLNYHNGVPIGLSLTYDFEEDIKEMVHYKKENHFWNWEMPLRALRHHMGNLETVTIVCSDISILEVHWFLNICKSYDEFKNITYYLLIKENNKAKLILAPSTISFSSNQGLDFESFDELSDALWELIKLFKRQYKYSEHDIMIDFTGGPKVTSVVAAAVTFNRKIKAQYVQTAEQWAVKSYDVIYASAEIGSLGL